MKLHEPSNICFLLLNHQGASTLENIEEWKWKLTMLLRNKEEQEVSSVERKDRRDFEQLSALATRMGLHRYLVIMVLVVFIWTISEQKFLCSRQYSKVVVFSKAPLPNYRSDLDLKRPQREVTS